MRLFACAIAPFVLFASAASAQTTDENWARYPAAREVQLRDLAAVVRVVPQDRADVALSITNAGPLPAPELRISRNRLIIDGNQNRFNNCRGRGGEFSVELPRHGRLRGDQLPQIELRVPRDAVVAAGGAVSLRVGDAENARITLAGCGVAEIDSVSNEADVTVAGSTDLRLYQAGSAKVVIAGSGDVQIGAVLDGLSASVAGAGDLQAERVNGPTNLAVQGAGDIVIRNGRTDLLTIVIAGAGDVVHNGEADRLDATIVGAGDVRVRRVAGEINRRVIGGGEVVVSQRQ